MKQGLYYVTEMERFAPPRKRPRTVLKNYRLLSLRSTTPEELYQRKVRSGVQADVMLFKCRPHAPVTPSDRLLEILVLFSGTVHPMHNQLTIIT